MSLNSTPSSERIQIGFFGKRNAGKSSLINAVTNQNLSIVSEIKGTTTDPVYKAMELLPLGPVTIIDTPGFDDEGELGLLRIEKTKQVLNKVDIALLITEAKEGLCLQDKHLIEAFEEKNIKYIIVYNKSDLINIPEQKKENEIYVSALKNININELKELIAIIYEESPNKVKLIKDLVNPYDTVILVTPIDSAAPKGRLILPQQQVIRDLLEAGAVSIIVRETELTKALNSCPTTPKLVVTDSQAFEKVNKETPSNILLTSFSILFARYKGVLEYAVKGVKALETLNDNDTILISEGCTHHRQCDDIGTVKLPKWIQNYTDKKLIFEFSSGCGFPTDLSKYKMIVHCGSCMLKDREVMYRYKTAKKQNVPISNYGITIAYIHGILKRSIEIFPDLY
ncbi:MAG: [FeFe] hydrogenase H-cluster maturation GTPase HydF, partial [Candidatus Gastranaerophilales bacterium]|nr:[FeFe] hydrogenase H-cluster maturation GTPase HydF [Candidatus Gastranaerophilales bacterium]